MQIYVAVDGTLYPIDVEPYHTIKIIKNKIQDKQGHPCRYQRLFFNGRRLEDNVTLLYYQIINNSTLDLKFQIKDKNGPGHCKIMKKEQALIYVDDQIIKKIQNSLSDSLENRYQLPVIKQDSTESKLNEGINQLNAQFGVKNSNFFAEYDECSEKKEAQKYPFESPTIKNQQDISHINSYVQETNNEFIPKTKNQLEEEELYRKQNKMLDNQLQKLKQHEDTIQNLKSCIQKYQVDNRYLKRQQFDQENFIKQLKNQEQIQRSNQQPQNLSTDILDQRFTDINFKFAQMNSKLAQLNEEINTIKNYFL